MTKPNPIIGLPNRELLRPDEVAKYLRVNRATIYRWIKAEKLAAVKIEKLIRITRESTLQIQKPYQETVALGYSSVF